MLKSFGCVETSKTMAIFKDNLGGCHLLSGDDITNDADFSVDDQTDNNGLSINYKGGDPNYSLKMNIACDTSSLFTGDTFTANGTSFVGNFKSSTGCKKG